MSEAFQPEPEQPLIGFSFAELQALTEVAEEIKDRTSLEFVLAEARARDRMDDTDPSYYYLAQQCKQLLEEF